ncbi:MAG TPA: OB-fold nucleic acid binding domain-containing protein, partial [Nitrososphaeraceae archaeon]|nr:OB-fold nucleic acid binding domain-containing protein [Nitrososphaeraceae archaeon]
MRIAEIKSIDYVGKEVKIRGWVYRLRRQKGNSFILLRDDRGSIIQCVFPSSQFNYLTRESSVQITGMLKQDARAPEGGFEIDGTDLEIF